MWGLGLSLIFFLVALGLFGQSPLRAAAVAPALGLFLPAWLIGVVAGRRHRLFQGQLVDAIDIIVRSLRAGHPVVNALSLVAREMPDPVGSEFGLTFDEMTYGLDLRDALENLARRVPNPELHYLVVAIRVQYGTGGNLAEVLSSLGKVLRERGLVQAKISAWSAEGRLSALVLSALPVVVGILLNMLNPDYYRTVQDDPLLPVIMGAGLAGLVGGMLLMRRMINFKM